MDRIDFVNSIGYSDNDFVKNVMNYFEQNMLLYNLVCCCNGVEITGDPISPTEIGFTLTFTKQEEIDRMMSVIGNGFMVLYGKNFSVIVPNKTSTTMEIILKQNIRAAY